MLPRFVRPLLVLAPAVLLGLVPPAHAIDGTLLINQATAANGLPGCGSHAMPIVICHAGSYRLSGNLTASGTDAIDITADGVTLDLNGFTIAQSAGGAGTGVASENNSVSVSNGAIVGFASGLVLGGEGETVTGVRAMNNVDVNIQIGVGTIRQSDAIGGGTGIRLHSGVVSNSVVQDGGHFGIEFATGGLAANNLLNNHDTCLIADGGPVNAVNNIFESNCPVGIDLRAGAGTFSGNAFDNVSHDSYGGTNGGNNTSYSSPTPAPPGWDISQNKNN